MSVGHGFTVFWWGTDRDTAYVQLHTMSQNPEVYRDAKSTGSFLGATCGPISDTSNGKGVYIYMKVKSDGKYMLDLERLRAEMAALEPEVHMSLQVRHRLVLADTINDTPIDGFSDLDIHASPSPHS